MSNPLFQSLGGNQSDVASQFRKFMSQMQGKNPHEEINKLLQSGAVSQQQLNQAQQMAHQVQGLLGMFQK